MSLLGYKGIVHDVKEIRSNKNKKFSHGTKNILDHLGARASFVILAWSLVIREVIVRGE